MHAIKKGQLPDTNAQLPTGTHRKEYSHRPIITRRAKKINRNTMAIAISLGISALIMPMAVKAAYAERGYFAIGGEYLIPIMAAFIGSALANLPDTIKELKDLLR
jgi:hypothetical protein